MSAALRTFFMIVGTSGAVLAGLFWPPQYIRAEQKVSLIPDRAGLSTTELMCQKLNGSNQALKGLVSADFELLLHGARDLHDVSEQPGWGVAEADPAYRHFHVEFRRLSLKLVRMSESKNLEGAAYTFQNMTGTCIACHQHVRDVVKLGDAGESTDE
ncbi:hypothetical protein CA54_58350 [Symmachiella macrocystis]|uniref:Cytochrome C n=2 Tax=Symmachiella macrocystis TaxID=2527985 RepID=A0A5C6B047_9PLAN|nr:hypothetical protein CA54_58350 [Symmachiella macrocystis]